MKHTVSMCPCNRRGKMHRIVDRWPLHLVRMHNLVAYFRRQSKNSASLNPYWYHHKLYLQTNDRFLVVLSATIISLSIRVVFIRWPLKKKHNKQYKKIRIAYLDLKSSVWLPECQDLDRPYAEAVAERQWCWNSVDQHRRMPAVRDHWLTNQWLGRAARKSFIQLINENWIELIQCYAIPKWWIAYLVLCRRSARRSRCRMNVAGNNTGSLYKNILTTLVNCTAITVHDILIGCLMLYLRATRSAGR